LTLLPKTRTRRRLLPPLPLRKSACRRLLLLLLQVWRARLGLQGKGQYELRQDDVRAAFCCAQAVHRMLHVGTRDAAYGGRVGCMRVEGCPERCAVNSQCDHCWSGKREQPLGRMGAGPQYSWVGMRAWESCNPETRHTGLRLSLTQPPAQCGGCQTAVKASARCR
jgi:hypothetical protein